MSFFDIIDLKIKLEENAMKKLIVNQKLFSLSGSFWVTDENERECYQIKGSLFQVPKRFQIYDVLGNERAVITHKVFSLLPKFFLSIDGKEQMTISKRFSLFKPKYDIESKNIEINGNIWDMNFEILKSNSPIGHVDKKWFSIRDKYMIVIDDDSTEENILLVLGIVLAIDYAKKMEESSSSTAN
ncbi:hypothetical protein GHI93_00390 [Lactococcus hircilactis]|uniref:LURP-one-related family protein n=2 Tax=Lactococcus hircilactis TaxID=1494462 RepID=A0A7X2CZR5_9LACT|nr:hypothetical protein [Lactococcus hircilactis]